MPTIGYEPAVHSLCYTAAMPVDMNDLGVFGRYRLIRRMSLGGMAEVFKAKSYNDAGFEKIVALKRLLPSIAESPAFVEMFLQEATIAARLEHPNVGRLYELGREGDDYYLTMEYIYGHDLRQALKRLKHNGRVMDPWIAARIALAVCDGLDYAFHLQDEEGHSLNLVHRDISPQNIMVGFDGTVKVIDFGIAKVAKATVQTAAGVVKGKFAYMSPEHAESRTLDARSDIWSLGVVLHELLSGRRLFVGSSVADTLDQVTSREIPALESTAKPLAAIVEHMLQRDRCARYVDCAAVRADLTAFLASAPEPVTNRMVAGWMDVLFPMDLRMEADLTEADVRLVLSAEERGDETTDMRSDVSSATQIFLADGTGQADYKLVLEQLLAKGRLASDMRDLSKHREAITAAVEPSGDLLKSAALWCIATVLLWLV